MTSIAAIPTTQTQAATNNNGQSPATGAFPGDFLAFLMAAVGNGSNLPQMPVMVSSDQPQLDVPLEENLDGQTPEALAAAQMPLILQFLQTHFQQTQPEIQAQAGLSSDIAIDGLAEGQKNTGNLAQILKELKDLVANLPEADAVASSTNAESAKTTDASLIGAAVVPVNEEAQKNFAKLLSELKTDQAVILPPAERKELLAKLEQFAQQQMQLEEQGASTQAENVKADLIKPQLPLHVKKAELISSLEGALEKVSGEFHVTTNSPSSLENVLQRVQGKATTILSQAITESASLESGFSSTTGQNFSFDPSNSALAFGLNGLKTDLQPVAFNQLLDNAAVAKNGMPHPAVMTASAQLQAMANAGRNQTVTINLQPAELGAIEIRVRIEGGKIKAAIVADKSDTLDLMKNESGALEKSLQSAGLQIDGQSLSFDLREKNNQSFRQTANRNDRDGTELELDTVKEKTVHQIAVAPNIYGNDGKIDVKL